ncbi:MAG: KpsF/GutQ family sugar-phosphate isomerase [Phycisphaerales bacterium]
MERTAEQGVVVKAGARQVASEVLRAEADAVLGVVPLLGASFDRAVELLVSCGGSVIVTGIGKSGLIGQKLSATLASTGTPSHYMHATEAAHGDMGRIRKGDVVVLLSYGGSSEEVVSLAALLRQDKVPTVGITSTPSTHLATLVDAALCVGDVAEACPHNLAPTSSSTAMLALGDALAMAVSEAKHFTAEAFRERHPGGLLGRKMLPLKGVMRFKAGENLALIGASGTVGEVLAQAEDAGRRAGAVLLVDEAGVLVGILTDADVRRRLVREGAGVLERPVEEVMTRQPKRLTDTDLVRDAVQLVREVRLDEIPIVDAAGKPVGLIDVQDLIALRVIEAEGA